MHGMRLSARVSHTRPMARAMTKHPRRRHAASTRVGLERARTVTFVSAPWRRSAGLLLLLLLLLVLHRMPKRSQHARLRLLLIQVHERLFLTGTSPTTD